MKFLLISDLHLRNKKPICRIDEDFYQTILNKFEFVVKYADNHKLTILQAGDFFDTPRSYSVIEDVVDILNKYPDVKIYSVVGQHDMYMRSNKSSNIKLLDSVGYITIIENTITIENCIIHGCSYYEKSIPFVKKSKKSKKSKKHKHILVVHKPITLPENDSFLNHIEYTPAKNLFDKEYDVILCGDIHKKFIVSKKNRFILNTGPMIRNTVDDHIMYHKPCFSVYDSDKETIFFIEIPHNKKVITKEHIEKQNKIDDLLNSYTEEIQKNKIDCSDIDIVKNVRSIIGTYEEPIQKILTELIE